MTTAERRAVAALVKANHKLHDRICTWIPGMNSCDPQIKETMREFRAAMYAVEQLPGFRATEEKRTLLSPEEWERQFDQVNDALLDGHHNPEGYMEWWLAHHPKPKNKPTP